MRTVAEVLSTCDRKQLFDTYNHTYPITSNFCSDENKTMKELIEERNHRLNHLIDRYLSFPPKDSDMVAFVAHSCIMEDEDIDFYFMHIDDVKNKTGEGYGIMATRQEDIANFLVAETYTTSYYINELLAHILFESTWFGWEQERLDAFEKRLDEPATETMDADEFIDKLEEMSDFMFEVRRPEEEELYWNSLKEIGVIAHKYSLFCRDKEIDEILQTEIF